VVNHVSSYPFYKFRYQFNAFAAERPKLLEAKHLYQKGQQGSDDYNRLMPDVIGTPNETTTEVTRGSEIEALKSEFMNLVFLPNATIYAADEECHRS